MKDNSSDKDHAGSFEIIATGDIIGHYRIVNQLGSGGMADVYLAEDTKLGRKVALKFLSHVYANDESTCLRFVREARTAAGLNHPNIVTIHEVNEHKGRPYMAMEYIDGKPLSRVINESMLSIDDIIDIGLQLCEGLDEAHKAGVVHRDIKPANILMDNNNRCKLLDFGLAIGREHDHLTRVGTIMGTVSYMSPEQVLKRELDARSDIFSLGIVLYEMLTGCLPFTGDNGPIIMYSIAHEEPGLLEEYRKDLPKGFQFIMDRALAKDKDERYQSVTELRTDLQQLKEGRGDRIQLRRAKSVKKKIAILYFHDLTGDPDISWLSKGISHMLITSLEQSKLLGVVSYQRLHEILMQLGKSEAETFHVGTATEIAKISRASVTITGGIFKSGNQIRIDYQLNDTAGRLLKAGKVTGEEPFALVDKLGGLIRNQLDIDEASDLYRNIADVTTSSAEAYKSYIDGLNSINTANYQEAEKSFRKAIELDPEFASAYINLLYFPAGVMQHKELIDKALNYSHKLNPKEHYYILAVKARFEKDLVQYITYLKKIIDEYPDEKQFYHELASVYVFKLNELDEAIKCYQKSISRDPEYSHDYNNLAHLYAWVGRFDLALETIKKYISNYPDSANGINSLGEIYGYSGKPEEAIKAFNKSLELDYRYNFLVDLGNIYMLSGQIAKARDYYDNLASFDYHEARQWGRYYQGQLLCLQGKLDEALRLYERIVSGSSFESQGPIEFFYAHVAMSRIYDSIGCGADALREYKRAGDIVESANLQGWVREFRTGLVSCLCSQNNFDEARQIAREVKRDYEDKTPKMLFYYWLMKAIIDFKENRIDDAVNSIANYHKIPKRVTDFSLDFQIAVILLGCGKAKEAAREFERIQSLYCLEKAVCAIWAGQVPYYLAIAYEESGQAEKAADRYRYFLDLWKDADEGLKLLEDARSRLANLPVSHT